MGKKSVRNSETRYEGAANAGPGGRGEGKGEAGPGRRMVGEINGVGGCIGWHRLMKKVSIKGIS